MIKNYYYLVLLFPLLSWSQGITVSTDSFTAEQLVNEVLIGNTCTDVFNISSSASCGVGYFTNNGGDFPFENGVVLSTGQVSSIAGTYTGVGVSSTCSNQTDLDLQQLMLSNGITANVNDASFIKFEFVAQSPQLNFNYIYASQDYGQFQCSNFVDAFGIILTDLATGISTNLAVVPTTNLLVSPNTIRDGAFNESCGSFNAEYFGNYNAIDPENSSINLRGNTVPLNASSNLIIGNNYSLKFVVGDLYDAISNTAIFIQGISNLPFPCGDTIEMVAFLDTNTNGVKDAEEVNFKHGTFSYQVNNTGNIIQNYSPNGSAFIGSISATDTYDLNFTVDAELTSYFSNTTTFNDVTFVENSGINTFYFPITNIQPYSDLEVSLITNNQPQPGFDYYQTIVVTNNGTTTSNGTVTFTKDPLLTITTVSETGAVITPTGFTLDFSDLLPNQSLNLQLTALVPTIPTVALGDYLTNTATVTTTTDMNSANNTNTITEIIVGSYDPNDKMESRGATIPFDTFDSDDYLEYTIRFQNTGTFYATNVRIEDELESQLDFSSFQVLNASHEYTLTRTNNKLVWNFQNIFLPSIDDDEAGSNGYVRFRIKPNAGFEIGDIINNQAGIFFDFNPPIITNLFESEFTTTLATPTFDDNSLVVYPNPTRSTTTITSRNETIEMLKIMDITGKVIQKIEVNATTFTLNTANFARGIYLLEIQNSKQERVLKKLIMN